MAPRRPAKPALKGWRRDAQKQTALGSGDAVRETVARRAVAERKDGNLNGFSIEERQRALATGGPMPPAIRVPPARSAAELILVRLSHLDRVRRFIDQNQPRLEAELKGLVASMQAREPHASQPRLRRRFRGTLLGKPDHEFSVENVLGRLSRVRDLPHGHEALCARYARKPAHDSRP